MLTKAIDPLQVEGASEQEEPRLTASDRERCRAVEDALYRRACGYEVPLRKTYKVKRVEYDAATGKKIAEREELEMGVEETHVPPDVRVCAYYLNNRDPARWCEHPREESEEAPDIGLVAYPPMAEPNLPLEEEA